MKEPTLKNTYLKVENKLEIIENRYLKTEVNLETTLENTSFKNEKEDLLMKVTKFCIHKGSSSNFLTPCLIINPFTI